MQKTFCVSLFAFLLVLQANGSIVDLSKIFESMRSYGNDSMDSGLYKISPHVLDEFRAYVDGLKSDTPVLNLNDNSEMAKEVLREFNLIREAIQGDKDYDPEKLKPGQNPAIDCGEFGCCSDNSKASSRTKKECAEKLCEDVFKNTCGGFTDKQKETECRNPLIKANCPYTCGGCTKMPAPPIRRCEQLYPSEMCCWDGSVAAKGVDCKECHDTYRSVCKTFYNLGKQSCESNAWKIRTFLEEFCPTTCGRCTT